MGCQSIFSWFERNKYHPCNCCVSLHYCVSSLPPPFAREVKLSSGLLLVVCKLSMFVNNFFNLGHLGFKGGRHGCSLSIWKMFVKFISPFVGLYRLLNSVWHWLGLQRTLRGAWHLDHHLYRSFIDIKHINRPIYTGMVEQLNSNDTHEANGDAGVPWENIPHSGRLNVSFLTQSEVLKYS